jgi:anti-sigma B factor antagonist
MKNSRPVLVIQLPSIVNLRQAREFLSEVEPILTADRPRVVFECSEVRQIDSAGVDMLVQCLEIVMQRDGDLKLAALTPQAKVILELTRIDRLFEIFENVSDAVESFHGFPVQSVPQSADSWYTDLMPENGHSTDRLAG